MLERLFYLNPHRRFRQSSEQRRPRVPAGFPFPAPTSCDSLSCFPNFPWRIAEATTTFSSVVSEAQLVARHKFAQQRFRSGENANASDWEPYNITLFPSLVCEGFSLSSKENSSCHSAWHSSRWSTTCTQSTCRMLERNFLVLPIFSEVPLLAYSCLASNTHSIYWLEKNNHLGNFYQIIKVTLQWSVRSMVTSSWRSVVSSGSRVFMYLWNSRMNWGRYAGFQDPCRFQRWTLFRHGKMPMSARHSFAHHEINAGHISLHPGLPEFKSRFDGGVRICFEIGKSSKVDWIGSGHPVLRQRVLAWNHTHVHKMRSNFRWLQG